LNDLSNQTTDSGSGAGVTTPASAVPPSLITRLTGSPAQLLKSRLSWRIALSAFACILMVQAAAMTLTVRQFEIEKIDKLREITKTYISGMSDKGQELHVSNILKNSEKALTDEANITGITLYNDRLMVTERYGMPTDLKPRSDNRHPDRLKISSTEVDILLSPRETKSDYYVTARLETRDFSLLLKGHLYEMGFTLLGLGALATAVLMLLLGRWLLDPIMLLRTNLLNAARNPERPEIERMKKETRDEIGIAIRIANDLIRQNASNLKRLRAQAEDKIHKLAYYDALTGLPNRTFFIEKLDDCIKRKVAEEDRQLAVLCVDIDHFKDINDTMGHEFGDKLLEAIAKRLVKAMPPDSVISRASADEFIIMTVLKSEYNDSSILVDSVFAAMVEPVSIMQEKFQVRVSIGVAHCPDDGMDARQILKNADIALNRAKEDGRDTVRYYSEDFDVAVQQRFQMLRDLRLALDENQLQLYYHPQFDLKTGHIVGVEALLRWWRPDQSREGGSFIPPLDFIPMAEESGLIVPIGEWVLKTACAANKAWQYQGLPPFRIAVNISSVQFHRSNLVQIVSEALRESKLDAKYLELEVTESAFMENMQTAIDILNQLHRLGVELAIDDFGTGYSSLSYLRQFPIDRLKIDQSFIRNALINPDDRTIATTIINLGHSLNLKVMAEGVETAEHENFLKEKGCDEAQGYKYSKPIPAEKLRDFVRDHTRKMAEEGRAFAVVEDRKA
jgi:diguanylate cyclase (GGDEF)-like protein